MSIFLNPDLSVIYIKIIFLIFSLMLAVFLIVVLKQVLSLNTIIDDKSDSFILKEAALLLFIFSISLFLTALVIL
ncbi:hypothetical protein M1146_02835 [Patescibacteria group bacterium]|nr:hypothetical protein [Patescibacteria group bacterium]